MTLESDLAAGEFAGTFSAALLDPGHATPEIVVAGPGKGGGLRYNVYRNNVTVSLINVLADIYPAVHRITGDGFFRAMARFHVRAAPPRSPLLFDYGREFPSFIQSYEHARAMPWLADIARIERGWLDAYHAPDLPALRAEVLAAVEPTSLAGLRLVAHPAASIVRSAYPATAIFAMNRSGDAMSPLESSQAQDTLISRPLQDVLVSHLPAGGAIFLDALLNGMPMGPAATAAFEEEPSFDLPANLAAMIAAGVFTAIHFGD